MFHEDPEKALTCVLSAMYCAGLADKLIVRVGNVPSSSGFTASSRNFLCGYYSTVASTGPFEITCGTGIRGRYVSIIRASGSGATVIQLILCEVQV